VGVYPSSPGPFRGYGLILIIEHGEGYHSLLSGLGRIDGDVGQWVLAGEPVGAMGPATEGNPRLYLELRRQGHPINPQPWLAAGTGKVSG
jgi:murein hydrolase activator